MKFPGDPLDDEANRLIDLLPEPLRAEIRELAPVLCSQGLIQERTSRRRQTTYRLRFRLRDAETGPAVQRSLSLGTDPRVMAAVRDVLDYWRRKKPRMCRGEPAFPIAALPPSPEDQHEVWRKKFDFALPSVGRRVRAHALKEFDNAIKAGDVTHLLCLVSPLGNTDARFREMSRPGRRSQCRIW